MQSVNNKLIYSFFAATFYLLLFSNLEKYALFFQLASVAILIFAAISVLLTNLKFPSRSSGLVFMLYAVSGLSLGACFFYILVFGYDLIYQFIYTLLFLLVILSLNVLSSKVDFRLVIFAASAAYLGMLATVVVAEFPDLMLALAFENSDRWATRFTPFDMHPNLVGFVFGCGAIIFLYTQFLVKNIYRLIFIPAFFLSLSFVFAASARASLLAFALSSIFIFFICLKNFGKKFIVFTFCLSVAVMILAILNGDVAYKYLEDVLELNSSTRGIDSGGTGRVELWSKGIDLVFNDPLRMVLGGGIRSASPEIIGFSTENSYITIILESGILVGGFSICVIYFYGYRLTKSVIKYPGLINVCLLHMLTFALIQSFFNRYLMAIGNSSSLFLLVIFVFLSDASISRNNLIKIK